MGAKMEQAAYLILEDGTVFAGTTLGAPGEVVGEVVFTTAMTGYLETLTDPSYYGQIVVQTFPLIGNYGVIPQDFESGQPYIRGYIVHEWCHVPSNFRQEGTLDAFLKAQNIVGLCGIDTRALTKRIREKGVMNGKIVPSLEDIPAHVAQARAYRITRAVEHVGSGHSQTFSAGEDRRHVVLWDFGAKQNIVRELVARDCRVTCVPCETTADEILALKPQGIMLSNGPGDPADNPGIVRELEKLCGTPVPIFGICLGHQLLALARGGRTGKLHYGHRGANQPVREQATGRVYITSQNHGYAVDGDSLPQGAQVSFINANDGTCEGVDYPGGNAFSVQFHPEGCGGPKDTRFLFDRFIGMMGG